MHFGCILQNVSRYQSLSQGAEMTESQLKGQLAEYLNAEIVLLTIPTVTAAMGWLRQSFLYVRVSLTIKSPQVTGQERKL